MKRSYEASSSNSYSKRRKTGGLSFIRSLFSVIVLSALVLFVAYLVKQLSSFDSRSVDATINKLFTAVGYDNPRAERVAGDLIKRATDVSVENEHELNVSSSSKSNNKSGTNVIDPNISATSITRNETSNNINTVLKVGVASDAHLSSSETQYSKNTDYLKSLFNILSKNNIKDLLFLGDLTNYGDTPSLQLGNSLLQNSGLTYKVLPGDRDLAASVGLTNFTGVFGEHNYAFELKGYKFVMLDNSANYTPISKATIDWFDKQIADADFVLLSQPIYTDGLMMFSNVYMGSTMSTPESADLLAKQDEVKTQRNLILSLIRATAVKGVIAGDHHKSSMIEDKLKPGLKHYVVGAVGGNVSEYSQNALQTQRFSIFEVYSDGTFDLKDTLIDQL